MKKIFFYQFIQANFLFNFTVFDTLKSIICLETQGNKTHDGYYNGKKNIHIHKGCNGVLPIQCDEHCTNVI